MFGIDDLEKAVMYYLDDYDLDDLFDQVIQWKKTDSNHIFNYDYDLQILYNIVRYSDCISENIADYVYDEVRCFCHARNACFLVSFNDYIEYYISTRNFLEEIGNKAAHKYYTSR